MEQAEAATAGARTLEEATVETNAPQRVTGSITQPTSSGSQKLKVYSDGVVNIGRAPYLP